MKKYLAIMMCAGLLLTATGCGAEEMEDSSKKENSKVEEKAKNKVLSCSQSYEDIMSIDATFVYDLEGKKISEASMNYTIKVDEDELEDLTNKSEDELCEDFGDYASIKKYDAKLDGNKIVTDLKIDIDSESIKKCDAKLDGNKIVANLKYDIDKLDEEEDGFTKDTTIDELKEIMEDEEDEDFAQTCKIEEK